MNVFSHDVGGEKEEHVFIIDLMELSLLTSSKSVDVEAVKSTSKSKVVEKSEEQDSDSTDLDSEDDLDLDLYGISRRKVDKP
ncbi:hypothetical protein Avbf_03922 [Armadillidium vulgare]|nr:hypothetical protein Avbf_03922 [Armadillidium vulgare]